MLDAENGAEFPNTDLLLGPVTLIKPLHHID